MGSNTAPIIASRPLVSIHLWYAQAEISNSQIALKEMPWLGGSKLGHLIGQGGQAKRILTLIQPFVVQFFDLQDVLCSHKPVWILAEGLSRLVADE